VLSWTTGLGLGALARDFLEVACFFVEKTYFGSRKIYLRKNSLAVLSKS